MRFLREAAGEKLQTARELQAMEPGAAVDVAGMVVCRQQPGTAKGIVFLLLEDEWGLVNVMISPELHRRQRLLIRTDPFLRVRGVLEGHAGSVPMMRARRLGPLRRLEALAAPEGESRS